jgi:hypothetical protein
MAITFAIGPWHSFQPSERVVYQSSGNRFSLAWGRGPGRGRASNQNSTAFQNFQKGSERRAKI